MNNTRRKAIKQTIDRFDSIRKRLDELVSEVESVKSDVEYKYNNSVYYVKPEGIKLI